MLQKNSSLPNIDEKIEKKQKKKYFVARSQQDTIKDQESQCKDQFIEKDFPPDNIPNIFNKHKNNHDKTKNGGQYNEKGEFLNYSVIRPDIYLKHAYLKK